MAVTPHCVQNFGFQILSITNAGCKLAKMFQLVVALLGVVCKLYICVCVLQCDLCHNFCIYVHKFCFSASVICAKSCYFDFTCFRSMQILINALMAFKKKSVYL